LLSGWKIQRWEIQRDFLKQNEKWKNKRKRTRGEGTNRDRCRKYNNTKENKQQGTNTDKHSRDHQHNIETASETYKNNYPT